MSDPLNDPRFIMNRINQEFFGTGLKSNMNAGTPMVENSLHSNELMAFRGDMDFNPVRGLMQNLLPNSPVTQHAIKDNNVPLRNNFVASPVKGMRPSYHNALPNTLNNVEYNHLRGVNVAHLSANDIGAGKAVTAADLHKLDHELNAVTRNVNPIARALAPTHTHHLNPVQTETTNTLEKYATDDLKPDASSLRAAATETTNELANIASLVNPTAVKSSDILPSNPGTVTPNEVGANFSSLKAFLEADNTLRKEGALPEASNDNPLEALMHKKYRVPKYKRMLKKIISKRKFKRKVQE